MKYTSCYVYQGFITLKEVWKLIKHKPTKTSLRLFLKVRLVWLLVEKNRASLKKLNWDKFS